ncbi:hypothetical protein TCAL_02127 [Tigriopus californicus]|uniref:VWFA domain-containing protein n=1 Tax=Tigriopus californicus TaxID=6832 RepID=A0A553N8J6_TIGCA|nr:VWFA and cache domain-containing protein 1-like [Tigriopus californicus]TRY61764.1 hypothetical protein TCAL_02127 [Tigriopus californicus]
MGVTIQGMGWGCVLLLIGLCVGNVEQATTQSERYRQFHRRISHEVESLFAPRSFSQWMRERPSSALNDYHLPELWEDVNQAFQSRLSLYRDILRSSTHAMHTALTDQDSHPLDVSSDSLNVLACCDVDAHELQHDRTFGMGVNAGFACQLPSQSVWGSGPAARLTELFQDQMHSYAGHGLRWQFVMDQAGRQLEYPTSKLGSAGVCGLSGDTRHRDAYRHTFQPGPRPILVILDRDLRLDEFEVARGVVRYVGAILSESDSWGVIALSDGMYFPLSPDCSFQKLVPASPEAKLELLKFINVVQPSSSPSDLSMALKAIPTLLHNTLNLPEDCELNLIVITSKDLDNDNHTHFWRTLSQTSHKTTSKIAVHKVLIRSPGMDSKFHARWHPKKRSNQEDANWQVVNTFMLNSTKNIGMVLGNLLHQADEQSVPQLEEQSPLMSWEPLRAQTTFTFSKVVPVPDWRNLMYGFEVSAVDFLEDYLQFPHSVDSFVILAEKSPYDLNVIYHPLVFSEFKYTRANFESVMQLKNWSEIKQAVLSQSSGQMSVEPGLQKSKLSHSNPQRTLRLLWKWIDESNYVSLLIMDPVESSRARFSYQPGDFDQLSLPMPLYPTHDVTELKGICRLYHSLATMQTSSLHFAPSAFVLPPRHRMNNQDQLIKNWLAYFADQTGLISNPGFKSNIKRDVVTLTKTMDLLLSSKREVKTSPGLVRRYVATQSGILVCFPGKFDPGLDFTQQTWFINAIRNPDRVMFTAPYLDPLGAGYIVTLSLALAIQNSSYIVFGADVGLSFLDDILHSSVSDCQELNVKCVLFGHDGYLSHHPLMVDPVYIGPIQGVHILQQEPKLGKEFLDYKSFAEKKFCKSIVDEILQSYYRFNQKQNQIIQDSESSWYSVMAVESTNLFMAVVNYTRDSTNVFCPCNINSRKCLYCPSDIREALHSCECPCECPLRREQCPDIDQGSATVAHLPLCPRQEQMKEISPMIMESFNHDEFNALPKCVLSECSSFIAKDICNADPECSWCQVEIEVDPEMSSPSFVPLSKPFCGDKHQCFRGAAGTASPYEIHKRSKMLRDRADFNDTSAVGSIAGSIVMFFVFMAFSVFCYRNRQTNGGVMGMCGSRLIRSDSYNTRTTMHSIEDIGDDHLDTQPLDGVHYNAVALQCTDDGNLISPYNMNPEYRRPPPGTDSDHGYSTVTPMGDIESEISPCYEQSGPSRARLSYRPPPSLQSVTSGISSRASSPTPSSVYGKPGSAVARNFVSHVGKSVSSESDSNSEPHSALKRATLMANPANTTNTNTTQLPLSGLLPNQIVVSATVHQVDIH